MRPARRLLAAVFLIVGTGIPFLPAAEPDFSAQIREEIERLGRDAESASSDRSAMAEAVAAAQAAVKSAREALQAERPYLALERLVQAIDLLEGIGEAGGKGAAVANSLAAFEAEWAKTS